MRDTPRPDSAPVNPAQPPPAEPPSTVNAWSPAAIADMLRAIQPVIEEVGFAQAEGRPPAWRSGIEAISAACKSAERLAFTAGMLEIGGAKETAGMVREMLMAMAESMSRAITAEIDVSRPAAK